MWVNRTVFAITKAIKNGAEGGAHIGVNPMDGSHVDLDIFEKTIFRLLMQANQCLKPGPIMPNWR